MKHTISPDRKTLTIHVDDAEREELRELGQGIHQDQEMFEFLEPLICNSELEWINPADTGDLTDAPMLGIRFFDNESRQETILERWAFMSYQVRSVLEDLRDKGEAIFIS
jgi:hypothetical protein